jgi:hypothetical protein
VASASSLHAPLPPELQEFADHAAAPARQFDLIAFDWDGTLFDSTGIIVRCIQRRWRRGRRRAQ